MKIIVADTYEVLSTQVADDVIPLMGSRSQPVICTASGDSPAGLYREVVRRTKSNQLNVSDWLFVGLDEWVGMNAHDEGSCRFYLDRELFHPLKIAEHHICFFDGRTSQLEMECSRIEDFIKQHGGIDVAILGLGMNGHIGMNEPGASATSRSHVTELTETTRKVGQKYFKRPQELTEGITLGIGTLMQARHIFLIVSGKHKAEIVKQVIEDEISEQLPASLLRKHSSFRIYLDKEAAEKMIQS